MTVTHRPSPWTAGSGRLSLATVAGALSLLALAACATDSRPPPAGGIARAPTPTVRAALTLDTPVQTIVATPGGKAVLDRDLPGLTTNPSYGVFKAMSLNALQPLSNGKLTKQKLAVVQADLAKLSASPPTP